MRRIVEPTLFLRSLINLPINLKLSSRFSSEGWLSILGCDSRLLSKRATKCGWQLEACSGRSLTTGMGQTEQAARANALKLALEQVGRGYDVVRVEYIQLRQYPWFYLATIAVFTHAIGRRADQPAFSPAC